MVSRSFKSGVSKVVLIPWDPDSKAHVQRLYDQRIACGWMSTQVEYWANLQREGTISLQWVIISDDDPEKDTKISAHVLKYLAEAKPIRDTAITFGGKPRVIPSATSEIASETSMTGRDFIPVGHISLDSYNEIDPSLADPAEHLYCISKFYISSVLQSCGLGRAAMDELERVAISEPLCARALSLDTIAKEHLAETHKWLFFKDRAPKLSNQDWYERRGYKVYKVVQNAWKDFNPPNLENEPPINVVFLKKEIS